MEGDFDEVNNSEYVVTFMWCRLAAPNKKEFP